MIKNYVVVFQNERTKKVAMDIFSTATPGAAKGEFFDCYRHENYRVLGVVEIPESDEE